MKKYLVLFLLNFVLVSCWKQENQPVATIEIPKNTKQEVSKNKENLFVENNSISNTWEVIDVWSWKITENNSISIEKKENLQNTESDEILDKKDLWNWFTLNQTEDKTNVLFNGIIIKTYNHISKEIPFIWDEWCEKLTKKFDLIWNNWVWNWKQETWDSLWEKWQKECLRENYKNTLSIEKINQTFFTINKWGYKWVDKTLIDISDLKSFHFNEISADEIIKIDKWNIMIYLQWKWFSGNDGWLLWIDLSSWNQKILFRNYADRSESEKEYKEMIDFKLLINKQVEIKYKWQNWSINSTIINI